MKKAISFMLVFALLFALIPVSPAYAAFPPSFDKSRVHWLDNYVVTLQIGDMTFNGKLTNAALDDAKLEELVRKVLADMNMTELDFETENMKIKVMESYDTITPQQAQEIYDRWLMMLGGIPGVGKIPALLSTAIGLVQAVMQYAQGRYTDGNLTVVVESGQLGTAKYMDTYLDAVSGTPGSSKLGGHVSSVISVLLGLVSMVEGMMSSDFGARTKARAAGSEAYRKISDFYAKLNSEVEKYYHEDKNYLVEFDNAKVIKPVIFYGTQCTETWTLNMTMSRAQANAKYNLDGEYRGEYFIDIEYDMSGFQDLNNLNNIIQLPEWRSTVVIFSTWEETWGTLDITATSPGVCKVKRTLEGYATANIKSKGASEITPEQDGDKKDVDISGIEFHAHGAAQNTALDIDHSVSADENGFKTVITRWTVTGEGVFATESDIHKNNIPWDGGIWLRGDNAGSGWRITISPMPMR